MAVIMDGGTARSQARFIVALGKLGTIVSACERAKIARATVWVWKKHYPDFADRMADALAEFADRIEREAIRRAADGTLKGIWYKGERVGSEREFSDALMIQILRAKKPEQYRDTDTSVTVNVANIGVSDDAIDKRIRELEERATGIETREVASPVQIEP